MQFETVESESILWVVENRFSLINANDMLASSKLITKKINYPAHWTRHHRPIALLEQTNHLYSMLTIQDYIRQHISKYLNRCLHGWPFF